VYIVKYTDTTRLLCIFYISSMVSTYHLKNSLSTGVARNVRFLADFAVFWRYLHIFALDLTS